MCGICGIVNFNADDAVDPRLIEKMTDALSHRGPDDEGYFVAGNAGLGHRRLSIIDIEGGRQPIFNEDESSVIVFNGEIYNFLDLRKKLVSLGHTFRTRSDTEVILHAYEEHGDDCVTHLRGMFTFAIWDRRKKRLLLARDRLGVKPLYIYKGRNFLAFASEIKALLEHPEIPRQLEEGALDLYLSLRYVPGPRTMFKNIFKLQPGHTLTLGPSGLKIRKYWDIEYAPGEHHPCDFYLERFQQLLEESVRLRLISEVPLGIFLSGGLDSSAILAAMSRISGSNRVKSFSVGYEAARAEEDEANEFNYARLAAAAFDAEHHELHLGADKFGDFLPELVWYLDEPLADPTCIPLYFISRLAKNYVTVILSGEGADEILAGYHIYWRMLALERVYSRLPLSVSSLARRLAPYVPGESVRHLLSLTGIPLQSRYRGVSRAFRPNLKRQLFGGNGGRRTDEKLEEVFGGYFDAVAHASPLDQMLYVDIKTWLPDDLLLKADKMTMANAQELRVPFLDHKLVEFAAGVPAELKIQGGSGKALLRRAMKGVLPKTIIGRVKKGFPVPTNPWLRHNLKGLAREALLGSNSACRDYLDGRVLERVVVDHESGRVSRHQEIWTLLIFEYWHRVFMDQSVSPALRSVPRRADAPRHPAHSRDRVLSGRNERDRVTTHKSGRVSLSIF